MESQGSGDLLAFIKGILQLRALPITYSGLRELVRESFVVSQTDTVSSEEKFLNFLLSHSEDFSVKPDGSVILMGGVEYAFPQSVDTVDSIAVSDDSYFGDREEYISDSEQDSNDSESGKRQLLTEKVPSNLPINNRQRCAETIVIVSSLCGDSKNNPCLSTSSSDSSAFFSSSDTNENDSSTTDSGSSFESCDERRSRADTKDLVCLCVSESPSYSSCSDS